MVQFQRTTLPPEKVDDTRPRDCEWRERAFIRAQSKQSSNRTGTHMALTPRNGPCRYNAPPAFGL